MRFCRRRKNPAATIRIIITQQIANNRRTNDNNKFWIQSLPRIVRNNHCKWKKKISMKKLNDSSVNYYIWTESLLLSLYLLMHLFMAFHWILIWHFNWFVASVERERRKVPMRNANASSSTISCESQPNFNRNLYIVKISLRLAVE